MGRYHYVFPQWTNKLVVLLVLGMGVAPIYVVFVVAYGFSPDTTWVGYQPEQPVPFSHKLHVGQLGMDCRYCHTTVEYAAHAAVPPTQTCMNCHTQIVPESDKLLPVWDSYETGEPIEWIKVHNSADYAYFDHSAHIQAGVSCISCHGRVDRMEVVYQAESHSMAWCLECHRNPEPHLRAPDKVFDLGWTFEGSPQEKEDYHAYWRDANRIQPGQDCSVCHR